MRQTNRSAQQSQQEQGRWILIVLMIVMLLSFWFLAHRLERVDATTFFLWAISTPLTEILPRPVTYIMEFFHWRVLRHFIPLIVGVYLAHRAAVGLIKTLYDLPDDNDATQFLQRLRAASPGGINPVMLKSSTLEADRANSIVLRVGGPAKVKIGVSDAVVTELNGRFKRVLGAGTHKLDRFETVHSVLDLHPQERSASDIRLLTKDGIELTADLTINFRLKRGEEPSTEKPFPFVADAVRQAAYYVRVHPHQADTWETLPVKRAQGLLYDIMAEFTLDEILEPVSPGTEPYLNIHKAVKGKLEAEIDNMGLELLSLNINRLELPQPVLDQLIHHWQSGWEAQRQITAAEGEAQALEEIEMARTEAEMMMIQAIAEGVRLAREQGSPGTMRDVLAFRLIEALEQMAPHSEEAGPLTGSLAEEILPRLTDIRREVAPPLRQ